MATSKKQNVATRIRAYQAKHPTASAKQVAEACKTNPAYVYVVRSNAAKWKTVHVGTSNESVVKHLGVTMAKDDVTKLTDEQTSRLVYNMTQGRARMQAAEPQADNVNHPAHYKVGGIETIDFIEAKQLNYNIGNVVKYVTRADHKGNRKEDLLKARWYLNREIEKFTNKDAA